MLKAVIPRWSLVTNVASKRQKAMFRGSFPPPHKQKGNEKLNILYLNVSHGDTSLVSCGAKIFLDNLSFATRVVEKRLWSEELVQYRIEHAISKLRLLQGEGTAQDEESFGPIRDQAEEMNQADMVLVATPMWNYSVPYVLKQYIDTVVQPGINFHDTDNLEATAMYRDRVLVVFSSAGAIFSRDGGGVGAQDHLNPYLKSIFGLMGFTRHMTVFTQGTSSTSREDSLLWTEDQARQRAAEVNQLFGKL